MSDQWLRKIQLVVTPGIVAGDGQGLDLSEMHISFQTIQADVETPNSVYIRVYNLSPNTMNSILEEYNGVILSAGYQDSAQFGMIFKGTLKQIIKGRSNPTDTFLDIYAGDYELVDYARISEVLPAPVLPAHQLAAINKGFGQVGILPSQEPPTNNTQILPQSKVMYGSGRMHARNFATSQLEDWSIQNGRLQRTDRKGYRNSGTIDIVEINQTTGMIGVPQQTQDGIHVRTLLNPRFQIGDLVKVNARDIDQTVTRGSSFPTYGSTVPFFAAVNDSERGGDGLYRIFVLEHQGDTRGNPWYTDIVCLAAPGGQVILQGEVRG